MLVLVSTSIAIWIGVPAGVVASRRPTAGRWLLFVANIAQTIPSLALLGFLLPLPFVGGIGPRTALITLTLYALLPIVRTTVSGIKGVDPAVIYAGTALGMSRRQLLFMVELPLALPSIVGGVRVATVIGVGTGAIAAAIGAGGLGEYIYRGLAMVDSTTILAGAIPAAVMAVSLDGLLAWLESALKRGRRGWRPLWIAAGAVLLTAAAVAWPASRSGPAPIVVGSKNFTEQIVLGELVSQMIEAEGLPVSRKLNLGGTFICDQALGAGGIDVYVEYTGTAVTAVLHGDTPHGSADALAKTRAGYGPRGITVGDPLGFNNTFAILVRAADAKSLGLRTIADLATVAGRFRPGFGHEFLQREDGFPGLTKTYGLAFAAAPRAMELSLIYKALADGQVDVIAGDATSALISALDLTMLEDSLEYFPPYDAVPLVRSDTASRHPEIGRALAALAGAISADAMRAMNRAVDIDHESPRDVAARAVAQIRAVRK
ncbi:MAG: ABC transporter permease subunit [Acidobacteria bacterium]|nr:MAG: ABC transporter permease subunit [Acidobacteriota bacterium]